MNVPQTRYARTADGLNIAYQVLGDGPFDLLVVPGVVSNIEILWEAPAWSNFMRGLASFSRLIVFDRRGVGLSDRPSGVPPLEQRMDDVRAVLDAVRSERTALYGFGPDGAMAALFAVTYPERTAALILYAVPPRGRWAPDYPWGLRPEEAERMIEEGERRFADPEYFREQAHRNFPSVADNEEMQALFGRLVRLSVSPGAFAALRRMNFDIDIRNVLPTIRVPTLVLHRPDAKVVPVEASRYVAAHVPGATYQELEGIDFNPWYEHADEQVAVMKRFLERIWQQRPWELEPDRVLATILFTDIVDSTAKAVELGDTRWRELLQEHHDRVRGQLARFRGRELDTAGDGFFASFDGPARAIRCACAITHAMRDVGLDVRAGLHTGECEVIDGKIGGVAVHIGARVAHEAAAGEVLVSSTVKDLVAGSGLEFEDRGARELKGIPGEWRLHAVRQ